MAHRPSTGQAYQRQPYAPSHSPAQGLPQFAPPAAAANVPPGTLPPGTVVRIGEYEVRVERFLSEGEYSYWRAARALAHLSTVAWRLLAKAFSDDAPPSSAPGRSVVSLQQELTLSIYQADSLMSTWLPRRLPSPPARPPRRRNTSSSASQFPIRRVSRRWGRKSKSW